MTQVTAAFLVAVFCVASCCAQTVSLGNMECAFSGGVITGLEDARGHVYARAEETPALCTLRLLGGDLRAPDRDARAMAKLPLTQQFDHLEGDEDGQMQIKLFSDPTAGELIVEQSGTAQAGLHGIQWGITGIPLECNIVAPARSGIRLDRDAPGSYFNFEYPMGWEAQFVLVEGANRGFFVWAEDADGRYKNLRVWKHPDHWDLAFGTQNTAPFEDKDSIDSVRWRLGLYEGDWRVPARRYRAWAQQQFGLTQLAHQQPSWVKDIRLLVICGMELELLDVMADKFDPEQTILYVPGWRRDGYDRNYPDYTALPELAPFMQKAHELGFRVMLHVNYFGCDPKNELYEQFEPVQARAPFSREKLWWTWPPPHKLKGEEPDIKFAYINPASKAWRELFVSRMTELCERYDVDALHLDQTLCIWNHADGLIDGMTMLEGNLAEHRELRAALPHVALSGEGLNEVTFRYEAFAQRHAWGLNHSEGTWDRSWLLRSHPVASYIFRPYTIINGYLGMCSPANDQLYAAWMQAYSSWGVIPTYARPNIEALQAPTGFARQLMDEIDLFQAKRVDPDLDGDWAGETIFPYRTAAGESVRYVRRQGFALEAESEGARDTVSQTVTGLRQITGPGAIPGWRVYDQQRIFGLQPESWYPLLAEPRDPDAFHVVSAPEGIAVTRVMHSGDLSVIGTEDTGALVAWVGDLLPGARCGYTVFGGEGEEVLGPLSSGAAGASFAASSRELINLHPPWKGERENPDTGVLEAAGTGQVYALMQVRLPADGHLSFSSDVYMAEGAVGEGKTDGVTFSVEATAGDETLTAQLHTASAEMTPLNLDLDALAGKEIALRLTGDPGPDRAATFDWARWSRPRITRDRQTAGELRVVSPEPFISAIASAGPAMVRALGDSRYSIGTRFPGDVYLLNAQPGAVAAPCDLTQTPFARLYASHQGTALHGPQFASGEVGSNTVGGVEKHGFFAHPPDRGQTRLEFPLALPEEPVEFRADVGLRDGSKSDGCLFIVEVTGQEVARKLVVPGKWHEVNADLAPWAGKTVVLSLVSDAVDTYYFDWACWGEPRLE